MVKVGNLSPDESVPSSGARLSPVGDAISTLEALNFLLRHRYRILLAAVVVGVTALVWSLLMPIRYRATMSFVPQGTRSRAGGLASLADQLGVSVPMADGTGSSPAFYGGLLDSREILSQVARSTYRLADEGTAGTQVRATERSLADIIGIHEEATDAEVAKTVEWLREDALQIRVEGETGIVHVAVETRWASLSHAIVSRMLELLEEFNRETRRSQASAERQFVEARLEEARDSLRAAEDRLAGFLEANRQFENSPELSFQHDRLERQVVRSQQLVNTLGQSYEEARISEVRDTPVLTVVDPPERPVTGQSRRILLRVLIGILLGTLLGLLSSWVHDLLERGDTADTQAYTEFAKLWRKTWWDIRTLGGRLS